MVSFVSQGLHTEVYSVLLRTEQAVRTVLSQLKLIDWNGRRVSLMILLSPPPQKEKYVEDKLLLSFVRKASFSWISWHSAFSYFRDRAGALMD
jgi:hypothetical protein